MRRIVLATLVLALIIASPALAGDREKQGFNLGLGIGAAKINFQEGDWEGGGETDFDEDDLGYKIFAGYRFLEFLGVEAAYVDFGNPSRSTLIGDIPIDTEAELSGWDLAAVGYIPIGIFDLYAKVGFFWWDGEVQWRYENDRDREDESGTDIMYGLGAAVWVKQLSIRLEFEMFDVERMDDVYLLSLGVGYTF